MMKLILGWNRFF